MPTPPPDLARLLEAVDVLDRHARLARGPNWAEMLSARQAAALLREAIAAIGNRQSAIENSPNG